MTEMPSTGKAKRSKGGKKNELLAKPKRPMSAYNFFFRAERANILAESSDSNNRTSFEDIGRIIGQRWRSIEETELAKYKRMAKTDNERYRDQMKSFYKDELSLMCLGHNDIDAMPDENAGDPKKLGDSSVNDQLPKIDWGSSNGHSSNGHSSAPSATTASSDLDQKYAAAAAPVNENSQMTGIIQQLPMFTNHATSGQSQINTGQGQMQLANERSNSAGMLNPFHNTHLQNKSGGMSLDPMRSISSMEPKTAPAAAMGDDQILQLLLQHQQSSSSFYNGRKIPNNTVVALILTQKASIQQRQQKLSEELKSLQLKNALLDKMLANEVSTLPQQNTQGNEAHISTPSPSGVQGEVEMSSTGQLLQSLQQQKPATNGIDASIGSRAQADGQALSLSAMFAGGPPPAPAPPMQELLYRNNQPSLSHFTPTPPGMNAPGNNASTANHQGNPVSMEEMFMKHFMDKGK